MKILGVDPGLRATGYGVIDVHEGNESFAAQKARAIKLGYSNREVVLLETGTIEPEEKDLLQNKIDKIYKNLDAIIQEYTPSVMVLEKLYSHYRHPTTACILGHVRGVICLLCAHRRLILVEHSVKRIRKALLGNGNASKQQMQQGVAHILKINPQQLTLDASDALALALGYACIERIH